MEVPLEKLVEEIIDILSINNHKAKEWIRSPRGDFPGCTLEEFIEKLLLYQSGPTFVLNEGWGSQTFNRAVKKVLVPIFGTAHGGNETWARILLNSIEVKACSMCHTYLRYNNYSKDVHNTYGIDKFCKKCKIKHNAEYYALNKDRYHKIYIEVHRAEYNARNAQRRAQKLNATPFWADLNKIKEFYKSCPEGYHVDHIVPLQGVNVCGLHVIENLQYLTVEDNLRKSNKF
jgi:hypothetical protein